VRLRGGAALAFCDFFMIHIHCSAAPSFAFAFFRLSNINQTAKILCDSLPRTILCQLTSVPIVSLYRDLLADALLRQSESLVREKVLPGQPEK
jgi:hypothetical protein